jgi:hypothetical protein
VTEWYDAYPIDFLEEVLGRATDNKNLPRSGLLEQAVAADGASAPPLNRGVRL